MLQVIDIAEKELSHKVQENQWLRSRIKAAEWEALTASREAAALKERAASLEDDLGK
mgnify:CR=1 FL=1